MPTYHVFTKRNLLTDAEKNKLAEFITLTHTKATGAPNYFVQVMIDEQEDRVRYLGGHPAERHIWINADIRAGRTTEQRKQLMTDLMQGVSKITGVEESFVWVYVNNLEAEDMIEYGKILPAPGKETTWFNSLPERVQAYLSTLGVDENNFKL